MLRPAAPSGTRSCWRPSASTPPTRPSGKGLDVISGFIDELEALSADVAGAASMTGERRRRTSWAARLGGRCAPRRVGRRARRALAGKRAVLGMKLDRGKHASELKAALGGLKGPLMKVAQLLVHHPDALPRNTPRNCASCSPTRRRWAGRSCAGACAASSAPAGRSVRALRARGRGRRLARPGARAPSATTAAARLQAAVSRHGLAVEADLRQLKIIFASTERYDRAIDRRTSTPRSRRPAARGARLRPRGAHMRLYAHMLKGEPGVHVPEPSAELSTGGCSP
jgi:hypothetical protein